MTKASIITIGDELLIGQVIDTNSTWMAQELNKIGIQVSRRVAVGDSWSDIWAALDEETSRSQIVLVTGGLGPTSDDITKELLCKYFGGTMVRNNEVETHVRNLFANVLMKPMPDRNISQAMVPDVCKVLLNPLGTAPGMLFEKNNYILISLPGVPFEMKGIMCEHALPILAKKFTGRPLEHRTLLTSGIGESALADLVEDIEKDLPTGIQLAYLPNFNMVRLRLTANENADLKLLDEYFQKLCEITAPYLVVNSDVSLEEVVIDLLKRAGKRMATAESCTGGYIAHRLTRIPGVSSVFEGSAVSYSNEAKQEILQVSKNTLENHGAVSEQVVREMLTGVLKLMKVDFALSVSGVLGPGGGTPEKPVGTVWIAVGSLKRVETKKFQLRYNRENNMQVVCIHALDMLRKMIIED